MNMAKHTLGPWKLGYGGGYGKDHIYASTPDTSFGNLPLGAAFSPPHYRGGSLSAEAFTIMEANAALIAAAPDLLAGARAMLAAIDALLLLAQQHDPATGFNKPVDPYEVTRLLRTKAICLDARAAIAKASNP
jgi:hypothetical protein